MDSSKTIIHIHSLLKQFGIKNVVFCPGGRHLPLIHAIEQDNYFTTYRVIDERSAAFFALGLIQKINKPVAVCCSSGTAVINMASAVIEAFYQRLPLLVITGDRMSEYLNQNEDQQYDQIKSFEGYTKYQVKLPRIDTNVDEWYTNRLINEAMIELTHHGNGPVHIDYPIQNPFNEIFETKEVPEVRKINLHQADMLEHEWKECASWLKNKKVAVLWGQSVFNTPELEHAVEIFVKTFDAVILTDHISNCHHVNTINNIPRILSTSFTVQEEQNLMPDILISVGGNTIFNDSIKHKMSRWNTAHWQVGKEDKVIDGFRRLTHIFEMNETFFFKNMVKYANTKNDAGYYDYWKKIDNEIPEPDANEFNELGVIKTILKNMPDDADLQIGNSWSIRMTQLFNMPSTVNQYCNRGVNGIDGSLSTAVGYASANSKLTYLIIGDLSFFYDMNALWISSLPSTMRIVLINNNGGSMLFKPFMKDMMEKYPMSNLGKDTKQVTAEGWAKTCGFDYYSVHNLNEVENCSKLMADKNSDKPILVEAFTDYFEDAYSYLNKNNVDRRNISEKIESKIVRLKQLIKK